MLEVKNIKVIYSDVVLALRGISLEVGAGAVVALLGTNGAGKTTTLKAISGILEIEDGEIEEGTIEFLGERIGGKRPDKIVRMGICAVPEGRGIFSELTVMENLKMGSFSRKDPQGTREDLNKAFDYFPIIKARGLQLAGYLSGGEQQMLSIARGLMSKPKLMMLDEPSLGLAPIVVDEIFSIIRTINQQEHVAILLIEQNARIALDFAQYGYIMENGRIVMDADNQTLNNDLDIREFYLGLTDGSRRKNYAQIKHYKRRKRWLS